MDKVLILLELLTQFTTQAQQISALLQKARAENRDVTDEELNALVASDDTARTALDAYIAKAKAEGR